MLRSFPLLLFLIFLLPAFTSSGFPRSVAAVVVEAVAMKFLPVDDITRLLLCVMGTDYELLLL